MGRFLSATGDVLDGPGRVHPWGGRISCSAAEIPWDGWFSLMGQLSTGFRRLPFSWGERSGRCPAVTPVGREGLWPEVRSAPAPRSQDGGDLAVADSEAPEGVTHELVANLPLGQDDAGNAETPQDGLLRLGMRPGNDLDARVA